MAHCCSTEETEPSHEDGRRGLLNETEKDVKEVVGEIEMDRGTRRKERQRKGKYVALNLNHNNKHASVSSECRASIQNALSIRFTAEARVWNGCCILFHNFSLVNP